MDESQESPQAFDHVPVLPAEVLELLAPEPGQTMLDCTAGLGGHAAAVAERLGDTGTVVLNDLDPANLARATARLEQTGVRVIAVRGPFDDAPAELERRGIRADMVLADLGFASTQVDDPRRGLSFQNEGPLDMRLDPEHGATAADLVADLAESDLADVIYRYGEERLSRRIARRIVEARTTEPIETTTQLAAIVRRAVPRPKSGRHRIDPATRTFQALRIAVNDEIGCLERLLAAMRPGAAWLAGGARLGVIAFHSLEDRPVKQAFRQLADDGHAERLTRKPIVAGDLEREANPRARSAKLRGIRLL